MDGIPVTSVARTLLDLAAPFHPRAIERAIEKAVILEIYDHRAILSLLERSRGHRGVRRLRAALASVRPGETLTKSWLEERMLALCRAEGLPEPQVNARIVLGGEWEEVDFYWPQHRVVVETDGYQYHRSRGAFRRDRRRDRLLEVEGYGHARFAGEEFGDDRPHIAAVLRHLLRL